MRKQKINNALVAAVLLTVSGLYALYGTITFPDSSAEIHEIMTWVPEFVKEKPDRIVVENDSTEEKHTTAEQNTVPEQNPETGPKASENIPAEPVFTNAPEAYFQDALFIGDSRTVGLYEYGGINEADFFASNGMSVYRVGSEKVKVDSVGETKLFDLLETKQYGKIYVMFGVNELGYDMEYSLEKYKELVADIRKLQPDAILYLEASLHVSKVMSDSDEYHTNPRINFFNDAVADMADGINSFYLDVNPLFDDEEGNLAKEYTFDQTHLLGKYYIVWTDWLRQNAVIK